MYRIFSTIKLPGILCWIGLSLSSHAIPINFGNAGPAHWAVLQIGGKKVGSTHTAGNIEGNVGIVQSGGKLELTGSADVVGDVYLGTGATASFSGGSTITGTTYQDAATQAFLDSARADALAAAAAASALAGTALVDITSVTTMSTPGVYSLAKIDLNGASDVLTLTGNASDYYIFNLSDQLKLNSGAKIQLSGGLTFNNVVFNITGTKDVSINGSEFWGVILAPNAKAAFVNINTTIYGEVISGKDITFVSGARIVNPGVPEDPMTVPDGGASVLLMCLGLSCVFFVKLKLSHQGVSQKA